MKKPFPRKYVFIIGLIIGLVVSGGVFSMTGFSIFGNPHHNPSTQTNINNAELTALAFNVLEYIRDDDFVALSNVVHPDFGLVFSPGATINLSTNRRFSAEQVSAFEADPTVYLWGVHRCLGIPIELTAVEYFSEYVFSRNYIDAPVIGIDRIVRSGNALENIKDEFPGVRFVDFHIPGDKNGSADHLDWSSLRLGFEMHEDQLWLTVIVHSTWTV